MKPELRNIKLFCKSSKQMRAFNRLIETFNELDDSPGIYSYFDEISGHTDYWTVDNEGKTKYHRSASDSQAYAQANNIKSKK